MYAGYKLTMQVKRKKKRASGLLRGIMIALAVLFVLMGIMFSRGFMLPGFLMAGLYFAYDIFGKKEYEYSLENELLTIDVIYGGRYRKTRHVLNLQEMEVLAPNWHDAVAKYRLKGGTVRLPKYDYTSYDNQIPYYTMIIMDQKKKIKLLLDLSEEMMRRISRLCPGKVFFA